MATDYIKSFFYSDNDGYIRIYAELAEGYNWYSATIKITGGYGFSDLDENGETTFTIGGGTPGIGSSGISNNIEFGLNKSGSTGWGFSATLTAIANIRSDNPITVTESISGSGGSDGGSSGTRFQIEYFDIVDESKDSFIIKVDYIADDPYNTYKGIEISYSINYGPYVPAKFRSDDNQGTYGSAYFEGYKCKDCNTVVVKGRILGSNYSSEYTEGSIGRNITYYPPYSINLSADRPILKYNDTNLILSVSSLDDIYDISHGYIDYALSDTLTFTDWNRLCEFYNGGTSFHYPDGPSHLIDISSINISEFDIWSILKSSNKKYIQFELRVDTNSDLYYQSVGDVVTIMTDKGYPRVKNSDGIYETCIPYVLKEGTWTQCVLNSGVLSKLKDSSGEYILDSNGENIYTLEDSSVILNS